MATFMATADNDSFIGSEGIADTVDYSAAGAVNGDGVLFVFNGTAATVTGGSGTDALSSVENFIGSSLNDRIFAQYGGVHAFSMGDGNDNIHTEKGGMWTIDGGAGDDYWWGEFTQTSDDMVFSLDGSTGSGSLTGGTSFTNIERFALFLGTGNDTVNLLNGYGDLATSEGAWIDGADGSDTFNINSFQGINNGISGGAPSSSGGDVDTLNMDLSAGLTHADVSYINNSGNSFGLDIIGSNAGISTSNFEVLNYKGDAGDNVVYVNSLPLIHGDLTINVDAGDGNDLLMLNFNNNNGDLSRRIDSVALTITDFTTTNSNVGTYNNFEAIAIQLAGGANTLHLGDEVDTIWSHSGLDIVFAGAGDDYMLGMLSSQVAGVEYHGGEGNDDLRGSSYADHLFGDNGDDIIDGGAGNDTLNGDADNDVLIGGEGVDTLNGGEGNDLIGDYEGGNSTNRDMLNGGSGDDWIDADAYETIDGGDGVDHATLDFDSYSNNGGAALNLNLAAAYNGGQLNLVTGGSVRNVESLRVWGAIRNDVITDAAWDGQLYGSEGNDTLAGLAGNDVLMGGVGNDTLAGGDGSDWLFGGKGADTITGGDGDDHIGDVQAYLSQYDPNAPLGSASHLDEFYLLANEDLTDVLGDTVSGGNGNDVIFGWGGNDTVNGDAGNDTLNGGDGSDKLDGGVGADTLSGGLGDDTFVVDNVGDLATELAGQGIDVVETSISGLTLGANVENLTMIGSGDLTATGNGVANVLTGNVGNNVLNGGLGADTLVGGLGNDSYIVDNASDVISELADQGIDLVLARSNYALGVNVENVTLQGSANYTATGNGAANLLTGNIGSNVLNGGAGADTMVGGLGNDTYFADNTGDVVTELAGQGIDLVFAKSSFTLAVNVENLTLQGAGNYAATGNDAANVLIGNGGNNRLDGKGGADSLTGGLGNDTYVVDSISDIVTELGGQGIDVVETSVTGLTLGANIENLTMIGAGNLTATGNGDANVLTGNIDNNVLNGLAGADTMVGGLGNDSYFVDIAGDFVSELAGEGTDLVFAKANYTLGANIENLTMIGSGNLTATGNGDTNLLTGNIGNNVLNGLAGADTMMGGLGNDSYFVDNAGDVVSELAGEGTDLVFAKVSYMLGADVENLTLQGAGNFAATGNNGANILTGNAGSNTLAGLGGADTFVFKIGSGADIVSDFSAADNDMIDIHAYTAGITNTALLTTVGANTLIDLGGGNTITIVGLVSTDAGLLSHIVW